MWVKICANTNVQDAVRAAELGADAVGFVFAPSKRQVTADQVRAISAELPAGVERVGVFAGASAEEMARTVETARLTGVQLHGGLDLPLARRLRELAGPALTIVHTTHWVVGGGEAAAAKVESDVETLQAKVNATEEPARLLIDAKVGQAAGGTGVTFDWRAARPAFDSARGLRLILAGGLTPENVADAIELLQPWGVDVASGVEQNAGLKDWMRVEAFIRNARGA